MLRIVTTTVGAVVGVVAVAAAVLRRRRRIPQMTPPAYVFEPMLTNEDKPVHPPQHLYPAAHLFDDAIAWAERSSPIPDTLPSQDWLDQLVDSLPQVVTDEILLPDSAGDRVVRRGETIPINLHIQLLARREETPPHNFPPSVLTDETFTGRIVRWVSADTFYVRRDDTGETVQFRLWGIQAPHNRFADAALRCAVTFALGAPLTFAVKAEFRGGQRLVGWTMRDGVSLNTVLVENGLAEWYSAVFPDDGIIGAVEAQARAKRRGMWAIGA